MLEKQFAANAETGRNETDAIVVNIVVADVVDQLTIEPRK